MPEYLAPAVYLEEVSFRQKTIEGVSTSTTGFVGATRFGPITGEPPLLTSYQEFERIYGGLSQLVFADSAEERSHNYTAQAARQFFAEGGKRLYVTRTYAATAGADGIATFSTEGSPTIFQLRARYPGEYGNLQVTFRFSLGDNVLRDEPLDPEESIAARVSPLVNSYGVLRGARRYDVVLADGPNVTGSGSPSQPTAYWVDRDFDSALRVDTYSLRRDGVSPDTRILVSQLSEAAGDHVRVLRVTVLVTPNGRFEDEQSWVNLSLHPDARDSLSVVFDPVPTQRSTQLFVPIIFDRLGLVDGAAIADAMLQQENRVSNPTSTQTVLDGLLSGSLRDAVRSFQVQLEGGTDGDVPGPTEYEGDTDPNTDLKSGLQSFTDLEEISILAAPGSTYQYGTANDAQNALATIRLLIAHSEKMRYRIAVLDSVNGHLPSEVQDVRSQIDSTRAALYYPWVRILDPVTEVEIHTPPSGFVTGIYARTDVDRGVHKSPANEVIRLAQGFEFLISFSQQEILNPRGINCLRFFEGRGFRVWGARTATSDPEWKYVNVRRYFAFLERSIEKGTQWAVFENNGPVLWANIRRTVEDFLYNEFVSNHLLGRKPEEAYFVRCDETTMTPNDIDNGRLICLIGVAPLRPAEFVIFRIGQKTADARR